MVDIACRIQTRLFVSGNRYAQEMKRGKFQGLLKPGSFDLGGISVLKQDSISMDKYLIFRGTVARYLEYCLLLKRRFEEWKFQYVTDFN
ncbi:hypothetical protein HNY73_007239 [Argiope bruennichi]|uniref:Uncharacterized protein n=1 Tax=Argiope bruennichi TaxID=94029 RepID=A0A8T0FFV9_ARGBR|nr:hypothetical protein HNY73_007239 [Argiope bruennichi]